MDLGDWLWVLLAFLFWVMFIWMFITVFADVFRRRDLSGWAKAGWILLIFVLPLLGLLVYVIARPRVTDQDVQRALAPYDRGRATDYSTADELAKLRSLHEAGELTDDEFQMLKRRTLAET